MSLLRLPVEVEEIIANLPLQSTDSEELIFNFDKLVKSSNEHRQQECVC